MRFLFIDSISRIESGKFIKGNKVVSFEEGFLKRPYSNGGFLPRTLLLEVVAQFASWLIIYTTDFKYQPVIASIGKIEILSDVRVGSSIEVDCTLVNVNEEGAVFETIGSVDGKKVVHAQNCIAYFVPLEQLQDPDDAKSLFTQLTRKAEIL